MIRRILEKQRERTVVALARDQLLAWSSLAALIGLGAGFVNVIFRYSLRAARIFFWDYLGEWIHAGDHRILLPLLPMAGAAVIALLAFFFPEEIMGYGFPRFLEMVNLRGAKVRRRWIVLKTLAASATIGSGGSAGIEGPIAQAGGAVGYFFGNGLKLPSHHMRVLIACGSAGAIAAAFNAPIAGILFAEEIVLLGDFALQTLTPAVISAGFATVVTRAVFGDERLFAMAEFTPPGLRDLPWFILLGILLGLLSVGFIHVFHRTREGFERLALPALSKPLLGAFLVGVIGIFLRPAIGEGYDTLEKALAGGLVFKAAIVLTLAKMIAVSLTLGSGNAGGVFAPCLFIGGVAGCAYGRMLHNVLPPAWSPGPQSFALISMGAFLGAVTHAPLTGLFLVFELTDNYRVVLPAFFAGFIAVGVARSLMHSSIDTYELDKRGIRLHAGFEESIMNRIPVREVMRTNFVAARETMHISELIHIIRDSDQSTFPVVNDRRELLGVVTLADLRTVLPDREIWDVLIVADLEHTEITPVDIDENMNDAIRKFATSAIEALPVVQGKRVVGMVRRGDLVALYQRRVLLGNEQ